MNSKIAVAGRGKDGIKRYTSTGKTAATTNANSKYPNTKSEYKNKSTVTAK